MEGEQPAGWYPSPDPTRRVTHARYWDGSRWTDHEILVETALNPEQTSADSAPASDDAPPAVPADSPIAPAATGVGRGLLARLAVALLIVAVALPAVAVWLESADASGPVVFILEDETVRNGVITAPDLLVTSGDVTARRRLHIRQDGTFTILPDVKWSLDESLEIELIPSYPTEASGRVVLQLRENGARRLGNGWPVRIRIVATDRAFDVQVSQPVVRGIQRSREVVHQSSIPRSDERALIAAIQEETRERNDALAARRACLRDERDTLTELATPATRLASRYESVLDAQRIYSTGTITFDEYRRRIRNLASDIQGHVRDAERLLAELPEPVVGPELTSAAATYATLREAWLDFERALRTIRSVPGETFQSLYPVESGAIDRLESDLSSISASANVETSRRISEFATTVCEERHPLPGAG